jgi:DNA-binding NarL/FixJ family response regulator
LSVASYFFPVTDITGKVNSTNYTDTSHTGVRMSSNCCRILLADDHNLVAELCKRLLEPEFQVVGIVNNGRDLVLAAAQLKPDVIVVDIAMPVLNGLDAGKQVKEALPTVKLVYLTMNTDPELALTAFDLGASGYLLKTCAASEMVLAVREILRGKTYLSPTLKEKVAYLGWRHQKMVKEADRLSHRQREVLQLLAEGKVMKEIGATLNVAARTVAFHKYRIMNVLGAKNNADLVRYAVRNHLVAA